MPNTWELISPQPDQEGNKLQRQKILILIYPIYIIIGGILVLFIYITRLASNEIFSPSNEIHREVGRAKDLSAPLHEGKRVVGGFFRAANLAYGEAEFSRKVDGRLVFSHIFY